MTPQQKIKYTILLQSKEYDAKDITDDNIDKIYHKFIDDGGYDYEYEFREGTVETAIKCEYSRHLESKSVATQMFDGSWVGWTYWYGGGKHAEPEAIDWMSEAYNLNVVEEEKIMIVRTFTKDTK